MERSLAHTSSTRSGTVPIGWRGRIATLPLLRLVLTLPLLTSAFVDIPQHVTFRRVSGLGVLTIGLATVCAAAVLMPRAYPARLLVRVLPYLAFLAWIATSLILKSTSFWGVQNGLLYVLFGSLVATSGVFAARHPAEAQQLISRGMLWIDIVSEDGGTVTISFGFSSRGSLNFIL